MKKFNKESKKKIYNSIACAVLLSCILALPYYYRCKADLSYNKPYEEFLFRNSAVSVSILPFTKVEMLRDRALWYCVNDQADKCLEDLLKIENMKFANINDYSMMSGCYRIKGLWTKAMQYAQKSGKLEDVAKVYLGMNELDNAMKYANKAVSDSSNKNPDKYYTRAKVYVQMGKYYDALRDMNIYISLVPDKSWPYYERAKLKKLMGDATADDDVKQGQMIDKRVNILK